MKKKKYAVIGIVILILGILTVVLTMFFLKQPESWINLKIGAEEISADEYLQCMESQKYDTAIWLQEKFGLDSSEREFWEKPADGVVPYEKLADFTIEELKKIHAVYEIANECGYVPDASYSSMLERMEAENERRRKELENGGIVYGLTEYSIDTYMDYEMSRLKEQYCQDESNRGMNLTEKEVQEYYNSTEWIVGENEADLGSVRTAVEQELRKVKYDEIVEQKVAELEVTVDREELYQLTKTNLQ